MRDAERRLNETAEAPRKPDSLRSVTPSWYCWTASAAYVTSRKVVEELEKELHIAQNATKRAERRCQQVEAQGYRVEFELRRRNRELQLEAHASCVQQCQSIK